MSPGQQETGKRGEAIACRHLQDHGLKLIARNVRCLRGELDLIMQDGQAVVFVEVRYRRSARYGSGAESVDARKRAKLVAAALYYLQQQPGLARRPARFDVVAITGGAGRDAIQWIKDAFPADT